MPVSDDVFEKLAEAIRDNERASFNVEECSYLFDLVRVAPRDPSGEKTLIELGDRDLRRLLDEHAAATRVVEAYRAYRIAEEIGFPGDRVFHAAVDALDDYDILVGNISVSDAAPRACHTCGALDCGDHGREVPGE